jgi:hypothetical protein
MVSLIKNYQAFRIQKGLNKYNCTILLMRLATENFQTCFLAVAFSVSEVRKKDSFSKGKNYVSKLSHYAAACFMILSGLFQ